MSDKPTAIHTSPKLLDTLGTVLQHMSQLETELNKVQPMLSRVGISANYAIKLSQMRQALEVVRKQADETSSRLEMLESLVQTTAQITSSLELERVLDHIIDTVIQLTGAERAYLMLRDKQTSELTSRVARNWDQAALGQHEVVISHTVIDLAIKQNEPIITTNAEHDTRFEGSQSIVNFQMRSIMCIPLTLQGETLGVLYADNRMAKGVFSAVRVPLLQAFAAQAAIAIRNASAFEQAREDLEKAQRELQELRIQFDRDRVNEEVQEITRTDYFRQLEAMAEQARKAFNG